MPVALEMATDVALGLRSNSRLIRAFVSLASTETAGPAAGSPSGDGASVGPSDPTGGDGPTGGPADKSRARIIADASNTPGSNVWAIAPLFILWYSKRGADSI